MVGGAGGSGAHFGAIHMGGNMSFLKDNIMSNMQPKSGMIQSPLNPGAGGSTQPNPNMIMGGNSA